MVLLTAYYLVATGVQSWRLRSIYQKIAKVLDSRNTVVFLRKNGESEGKNFLNKYLLSRKLNNV